MGNKFKKNEKEFSYKGLKKSTLSKKLKFSRSGDNFPHKCDCGNITAQVF